MNTYTDEQITDGLKQKDINIALKVLRHINFRSAYGHNPKYCESSNILIHLLDMKIAQEDWNYDSDRARKALLECCRGSRKQLERPNLKSTK